MDWTDHAWRGLCLLAVASALTVCISGWETTPILRGLLVAPGLLVMLILVVARFASSTGSSTPRGASTGVSGTDCDE